MQQIPVQALPAQTMQLTLGAQACQLNLYQRDSGLYLDLAVNGTPILVGQPCQNLNRIVRDNYLNFVGDLTFFDTTLVGDDPSYSGLGSQFLLFYLEEADVVYGKPFFNIGAVAGSTYA